MDAILGTHRWLIAGPQAHLERAVLDGVTRRPLQTSIGNPHPIPEPEAGPDWR